MAFPHNDILGLSFEYRLLVRGEDWSCKEPGVNVLVLTENLGAGGEIAKGFHTQESRHAGHLLADYLHAVPHGRTVSSLPRKGVKPFKYRM